MLFIDRRVQTTWTSHSLRGSDGRRCFNMSTIRDCDLRRWLSSSPNSTRHWKNKRDENSPPSTLTYQTRTKWKVCIIGFIWNIKGGELSAVETLVLERIKRYKNRNRFREIIKQWVNELIPRYHSRRHCSAKTLLNWFSVNFFRVAEWISHSSLPLLAQVRQPGLQPRPPPRSHPSPWLTILDIPLAAKAEPWRNWGVKFIL